MSAKIITSAIVAAALTASLALPNSAAALDQDERNIVGGVVLGVLGTLAVQEAKKPRRNVYTSTSGGSYVCTNPYQTYRNGQLVTVCR